MPKELTNTAEAIARAEFEAFHGVRKSKGAKRREELFALRDDGTYADESVQRHWWTWQTAIRSLLSKLEAAEARVEQQDEAMEKLRQWARAYPLKVFPKPDFKRAHEVLTAAGMTLDAISASNMRHVITQVVKILDAALATTKEG